MVNFCVLKVTYQFISILNLISCSHQCPIKIGLLKNLAKILRKNLCQGLFFNNFECLRRFAKFLRTPLNDYNSLREKCPYSELFWPAFSRIRTEYRVILRITPYSVQMHENADQSNSEYRYFLRSDYFWPNNGEFSGIKTHDTLNDQGKLKQM